MARGWESKSVESQIEDRQAEKPEVEAGPRDDIERRKRREDLEMSRRRIARELESSQTAVHRTALENALKHLDGELKKLE